MKISIVIPAFNEERMLPDTLERVNAARQGFVAKGVESELIVCDNNSTDRTAEVARAAGATVVFEPINQISRARNRGAEAASGDWLLFIDADSVPSVGLFGEVAEATLSGRWIAGGSTLRIDKRFLLGLVVTRMWNVISRVKKLLAGSFIFVEAAAFRKIGGFSKELFVTEELDLSERLKALARETGKGIIVLWRYPLVTSSRKLHLYTMRDHFRLMWRMTRNRQAALRSRETCHLWYDGRR